LGQMEMSELIAAFFLSELATDILTNESVSFLQGLVPISIMIVLEFTVSFVKSEQKNTKNTVKFAQTG